MILSFADLALIEAKAGNLAERCRGDYRPSTGSPPGAGRFDRWRNLVGVAGTDQASVTLGLAHNWSPDPTALAALFSEIEPRRRGSLPSWVTLVGELAEAVACSTHNETTGNIPASLRRQPYVDLLWPVACFALEQANLAGPAGGRLLTERAWLGLTTQLITRMANVVGPAIHPSFLASKAINASGILRFMFAGMGAVAANPSTGGAYRAFVATQREDGLRAFLLRYPVAARLLSTLVEFWLGAVGEFLRNLETDYAKISAEFNDGLPLGRVTSIHAGVSDPHRSGRSVFVLKFEGGKRLVYKPRSLAVDRLFFDVLVQINTVAPRLRVRTLKVLDQGDHGWMEYAAHEPCSGKRGLSTFYRRAGLLVCLVHWLGGIDCHYQNIIAAGDHPILVDLETLAHPLRLGIVHDDPLVLCALEDSPLRTGLLPLWQRPGTGPAMYDNSGLCAPLSQRSLYPSIRWQHANTDRMNYDWKHCRRRRTSHRPTLGNRSFTVEACSSEFMAGYLQATKLLDGVVGARLTRLRHSFYRMGRRRIKRPTLIYAMLLQRSLRPEFLTSGIDRSIELHALPLDRGDETQWREEIASLEQLDVPYLHLPNDDTAAKAPLSPLLSSQTTIVELSLRRQLGVIDGSVCPRAVLRRAHQPSAVEVTADRAS